MNAPERLPLPDIQSTADTRQLPIARVGVRSVRLPLSVQSSDDTTVARDEKYVTERAYDNPKFVEDLVRDIALVLQPDGRIGAFTVESENFESIHNHSAYARIDIDKRH